MDGVWEGRFRKHHQQRHSGEADTLHAEALGAAAATRGQAELVERAREGVVQRQCVTSPAARRQQLQRQHQVQAGHRPGCAVERPTVLRRFVAAVLCKVDVRPAGDPQAHGVQASGVLQASSGKGMHILTPGAGRPAVATDEASRRHRGTRLRPAAPCPLQGQYLADAAEGRLEAQCRQQPPRQPLLLDPAAASRRERADIRGRDVEFPLAARPDFESTDQEALEGVDAPQHAEDAESVAAAFAAAAAMAIGWTAAAAAAEAQTGSGGQPPSRSRSARDTAPTRGEDLRDASEVVLDGMSPPRCRHRW
mmetsp:Transcript_91300/g.295243  ORF Transcript_91300/g.295243 Transcript_91300/m.295243 type:complete len:308 (+) Transcript_91300:1175-2098(+)